MDAQTSLFDMAAPAPPDNSAAFLNNDPDAFGCCFPSVAAFHWPLRLAQTPAHWGLLVDPVRCPVAE